MTKKIPARHVHGDFKYSPLFAALLVVFPAGAQQAGSELPEFGKTAPSGAAASVTPRSNGVTVSGSLDKTTKFVLNPEYSDKTGLALTTALAGMVGPDAAVGIVLTAGSEKKEALINAGYKLDEHQRFVVSVGQLKQFLDFAFLSGNEKAGVTQTSVGIGYQLQLGSEFLRFLEVNGYVAKTRSRNLADKTFAVDSATLFELWNDPRRIAGGKIEGLQGKLGFSPIDNSLVKVSLGAERLTYDFLAGKEGTTRATGGIEWEQRLSSGYRLKGGAESFSSQRRYTLGLDRVFAGSDGRHSLGIEFARVEGRDGVGNDNQLKLTWNMALGKNGGGAVAHMPAVPQESGQSRNAVQTMGNASLVDLVLQRPSYMPSHVVAKVDTTAKPTRLVAVNKGGLPAGTSINAATGDIAVPIAVAVAGIAGVTRNAMAFANTTQYTLAGNVLTIHPSQIAQPGVGATDTYVVTLNNVGPGTTTVTILVSQGSVKIDSISINYGAADVTAPATTGGPSVSGTTATATTLSATINENGTGYYLVLPAAAPAPSVAAVQAGTSFPMTANVAATPAITGLTASTAYNIWFVARDAANNVQAAVSSVAVTTTAAADVTAPTTTAGPSVSGTSATATTLSAAINENGTGYYLVLPAAAPAPSVAAVQAGTSFPMTANVAASAPISGLTASTAYNIWFVARDAANNVQAAVSSVAVTTTATADVTAPTTTAGPSVSGTTDVATTLSATIDENGTGYYLVLPAAAPAPGVAAVQAGTSFPMTANVAATPAITGLTASTAYNIWFVARDAANNVQAAVSSVAVTTTAAADVTAPTTTAGPSVSGTSATATTLSATINENGMGYYLVLPAAAPAPSVAAVQAGTSFPMTANVAATPTITGLTASTAYNVWFVARDAANNVQAAVQSVAVTTTAVDVTAPTTTAGPSVSGTTDVATTLSATINEDGAGYYLVLPAAAPAPSVAAVQAGTSFPMTANVAATPAITGLTASTAYNIWFVARDAANNVQAAVSSVAVTTTATVDVTAPTTTAGPSVSGTSATATTLSVTINENGTGYYLALPATSPAPTVATVLTGTSFAMTANLAASAPVSGLTANTAYNIWFVAKDAANNVQAAVSSVAVTTTATADVTAPTITAGPSVSGTTNTSTILSATINENGTGYYLVLPAAAPIPSVASVQAGGSSFAMTANVAANPVITGLTASTAYNIWFAAKDTAGNSSLGVSSVAVTTAAAADVTAPSTTAGPSVSGTSATATTLSATINENGMGYYLVLPAAAPAPSVAAVQAGTSFPMTANVAATPAITGLTASTAYNIWFVARDAANNVQGAVSSVAVTTTAAADVTAPTITAGPSVSGTSASGTTLSATINENGTGYYLVLLATAPQPSVAAVQAGTPFAMTANLAASAAISGLTANTAYNIWFVARDAANNVQATVSSVAVTTPLDTTPPVIVAGPSVSNTTATTTSLTTIINENGYLSYLALPATSPAPSAATVIASGVTIAQTANVASTLQLTGLTPATAYNIWYVARDSFLNAQAVASSVAVTTSGDVIAPVTTAGPSVSGTGDTSTTFSVTIDENGTGYYMLLKAALPAPSISNMTLSGTAISMTANTPFSLPITGLQQLTAYKIYFLAKDAVDNTQAAISSVSFTTTGDATPPVTLSGPSISGIGSTSATLNAMIDENGVGYYLVQPAASPAPSVAAVKAGTSFVMNGNNVATPVISGLTPATAYTVYFVARDTLGNDQASVSSVSFSTVGDSTPPTITNGPNIVFLNDNSASFSVTINENGSGYGLVLPATAPVPSTATVLSTGVGVPMTANVAATLTSSGLTASTAYNFWFVAQDDVGNSQAAPVGYSFGTDPAPDTTPPVTTAGPSTSAITATTVNLSATINETGTGFFLAQPSALPAPSVAVVLGTGTSIGMAANNSTALMLSSLTPDTAYTVYFVANDFNGNAQAAVSSTSFSTLALPGPTFTSPSPGVTAITGTSATLAVGINENGTGYYTVLPDAAPAPTPAALQLSSSVAMTAGVPVNIISGGLSDGTAYKFHFIAKGSNNNVQASVTSIPFTTLDVTAPTTTAGPSVSGTTATSTTLSATINENGDGYYVVLPAAAPAPAVAAVLLSGSTFPMAANVAESVAVTGLTASTAYTIWFAASDWSSNSQATLSSVSFSTP